MFQQKIQQKICQKCKQPFNQRLKTEYYSMFLKRTFCSRSCASLGKKLSNDTKRRISTSKKGTSPWNKGIKNYLQSGENNGNWKGGITPINRLIRKSVEAKQWRKKVFERDNYTCQMCKVKGVKLNADHIKPFAYFPELRFELSNGRTLCVPCHKKTPTWGARARYVHFN